MTSNRAAKRDARTRMEATGEKYVQAAKATGTPAGGAGEAKNPAPPTDPTKIRNETRELVTSGFCDLAEAKRYFLEGHDLSEPEIAEVTNHVDAEWRAVLGEQADWADEGDYPRLAGVFASLEVGGIVARMNFSCCQTCGHNEIEDERTTGRERGYVFFTQQDAEFLTPGENLYLAFEGFGHHDPASIGYEIAAALRVAGFTVDWNGSVDKKIVITGIDWRKRLPARQ